MGHRIQKSLILSSNTKENYSLFCHYNKGRFIYSISMYVSPSTNISSVIMPGNILGKHKILESEKEINGYGKSSSIKNRLVPRP